MHADFPTRWTQGDQAPGARLPLRAGRRDDGVPRSCPLALLAQVSARRVRLAGAGAPGRARDGAAAGAAEGDPPPRRACRGLGGEVRRRSGGRRPREPRRAFRPDARRRRSPSSCSASRISPSRSTDFEMDRVPAHLRPTFRAWTIAGRTVGSGRDLTETAGSPCRAVPASSVATDGWPPPGQAAARAGQALPRPRGLPHPPEPRSTSGEGITAWDLGDLPTVVDTRVAGGVVRGYPTLVDEGTSVALRIETTPDASGGGSLRAGIRASRAAGGALAGLRTSRSTSLRTRNWPSRPRRAPRRRHSSRTVGPPPRTPSFARWRRPESSAAQQNSNACATPCRPGSSMGCSRRYR